MSDPLPIAFALFAFALAIFGVRFHDVSAETLTAGPVTVGLNYAILVAGIAETLAGVLAIIRGLTYPGYVTTTFGVWLLGFYLLITSGAGNKEFTPDALAWYALLLLVPVVILAIPAVHRRNIPLIIAFVALIVLLATFGLGFHDVNNQLTAFATDKTPPDFGTALSLLKYSAYAAFVGAAAVWYLCGKEVLENTNVIAKHSEH